MLVALCSHSDDLVPVDGVLGVELHFRLHDELTQDVSGHAHLDAAVVGSEADTHSVSVDFQAIDFVNPDGVSGKWHSSITPSPGFSTLSCFLNVNNALRGVSV